MKVRKNISKLLALGFILNNISILFNTSSANTEIPNRYETLEGEQITINDSIAGELEEIEIFGNTVQDTGSKNLFSSPLERGHILYDGTLSVDDSASVRSSEYIHVKSNTTYSMAILNYSERIYIHEYDSNFNIIDGEKVVRPTNSSFNTTSSTKYIKVNSLNETEFVLDTDAKFQLNEGDKLLDYDEYRAPDLKDIQSVGDLYVDENGDPILDKQGREQYKIEILATGKNLLGKEFIKKDEQLYMDNTGDKLRFYSNGTSYNSSYSYLSLNIQAKPFTTYTLNHKVNIKKGMTDVFNPGDILVFIDSIHVETSRTANPVCFNTGKTGKIELKFVGNWMDTKHEFDIDFFDMQLEEGVAATPYQSYKEQKITILSPTPLEKVGDVTDRIIKRNGQWVVEKNIKTVIFNGSESWANNGMKECYLVPFDTLINSPVICNNFYNDINRESYVKIHPYNTEIIFKNSYTESGTAQFKEYLANNNTLVKYQTNKPSFIPLSNTQEISANTFDNITHLYTKTENGINPTLKVVVDRLPNISKDAVEYAKSDATTEKLSLARMYVNTLPESLYKDSLQAELNNIFSTDVTFDKKTVSSNVDVYIKSENMLSISLDTNSVTFEGYSGAAPMELKDAVNITINSSLPYDLNAYMPTEISNSDGSNTIDFDIFNIKESTEIIYNKFVDTANKVVLKSDCAKGNNKSHKIDLKLDSNNAHKADIYKTVICFEAIQK